MAQKINSYASCVGESYYKRILADKIDRDPDYKIFDKPGGIKSITTDRRRLQDSSLKRNNDSMFSRW